MSVVKNLHTFGNFNYGIKNVPADNCTNDDVIRYKARTINLIKYNPNLFTNRGNFWFVMGGEKTIITTLGCGFLAMLYRKRASTLRQIPTREAVWYSTVFFLYGCSLGLCYSSLYFMRWQVLSNEYFAHFLMKRYKGSADLDRHNIYKLKDTENTDDCYVFTTSYANNFHM